MGEYDEICLEVFLKKQRQLFPENVAETPEEAEDFLDMCMASVCRDIHEVQECFDEYGADISGMKKADLESAAEVFSLPDGRYLVVLA
ncbi:MAG: glyoxalase [Clostridiales bacterium]|nr:glyoxalase [Clostridiales bacterium]